MKPRGVAIGILGILGLIGIINSVLGNIVAALLQEKLGVNAGVIIVPFIVLAAILMGYELRGQLSQILIQDSSKISSLRQRLNRSLMIDKVEAVWIKGFLESSLYEITKIELQLKNDPTFVESPWEGIVQRTNVPNSVNHSSKEIHEVFREFGSQLLILGAPGSGKTTLLLELTKNLLGEARKNDNGLIPVVFNLSTWSLERKPLNFWLIDELMSKYDVPYKLAKEWINDNSIMLLLDGLDEVQPNHREQCIESINEYRHNIGFVPIAICSRTEDYESLRNVLKLQGAIVIKPLSLKQVKNYFRHGSFQHINQQIEHDAQLLELLDNPLMLNVVSLAFKKNEVKIPVPTKSLEQRRDSILDAYIEAMFRRRIKETNFTREATIKYLSWLAQSMQSKSQTVFHLEALQPEWLGEGSQQKIFVFIDRIFWPALLGLIIGFFALFAAFILEKNNLIVYFITFGIGGGPNYLSGLGFVLPYAILTTILTVMCGSLFGGIDLHKLTTLERVRNVIVGLFFGGAIGFLSPTTGFDFHNFPITGFLTNGTFSVNYVFTGSLIGVIAAILSGGPSLQIRHVYPIEKIQLSLASFAKYFIYSMLFLTCLWPIIDLILGYPLINPITGSSLIDGALVGSIIGTLIGSIGAIKSNQIEIKTFPNQGIIQSGKISLIIGFGLIVFFGAIGFLIGGIIEANPAEFLSRADFFLGNLQHSDLSMLQQVGGEFAGGIIGSSEIIPIAILATLVYGGYAVFSHYSIRTVLWLNKAIPLKYIEFLDYSVDRIFLRKVGGGYAFTHRLLLESFAKKHHH